MMAVALPNRDVAPEYALDEVLDPASDMYSLGCLMYAVHCKGNPPFKNHGSLGAVRDNAGKSLTGLDRLDADLRGEVFFTLLPRALTICRATQITHNAPPTKSPFPNYTPVTSVLLLSPHLHP